MEDDKSNSNEQNKQEAFNALNPSFGRAGEKLDVSKRSGRLSTGHHISVNSSYDEPGILAKMNPI